MSDSKEESVITLVDDVGVIYLDMRRAVDGYLQANHCIECSMITMSPVGAGDEGSLAELATYNIPLQSLPEEDSDRIVRRLRHNRDMHGLALLDAWDALRRLTNKTDPQVLAIREQLAHARPNAPAAAAVQPATADVVADGRSA